MPERISPDQISPAQISPAQISPAQISPGHYLRLRRQAAGLSLYEAARAVPDLLDKVFDDDVFNDDLNDDVLVDDVLCAEDREYVTTAEINRVRVVIAEAELDRYFFGADRAYQLTHAFAFDAFVYAKLCAAHLYGQQCGSSLPNICTCCGETGSDTCPWADENDRHCTARAACSVPYQASDQARARSLAYPQAHHMLAGQPGFASSQDWRNNHV